MLFRRLVVALVLVSGCSLVESPDPTFEEGTELAVTDYGIAVPSSRTGYARMAVFVAAGGAHIVDPGTGPGDPPRLVRSIQMERHIVTDAQIADDGYLWVATPDFEGGTLGVTYAVDPHGGRIHRAIELPRELRAVAGLSVGPDAVYFRAWRNGFSGGVGAVSRACTSASRACDVRFLAELGNVGGTPERALHYEGGALYSFNGRNSRDERESTVRLDPETGQEIAATPLSGTSTFDAEHFYVLVLRGPGLLDLVRLDKETLQEETSQNIGINAMQIAHQDGKLYVTDGLEPTVDVYDAASLQRIATIDVRTAGPGSPEAGVGFLAPDVLMLNHHAWLNTETNEIVADAFPLRGVFSHTPRLPQGHPLAF